MKISHLGEFELIQRLTHHSAQNRKAVQPAPGDDCAVVRASENYLLLTTDLLIEGLHFRRDWATPSEIGFKAMRVNISDVASMGGRPRYALISLGLPSTADVKEVERLYQGLRKAGEPDGVSIVGGDTNRADRWVVNVALIGEMNERPLLRSGARAGDFIYVTGALGGSALGLEALRRTGRGYESFIRRHHQPPSRVSVGRRLARMKGVHACIDLSDGLAGDVRHLLRASGVGAELSLSRIPFYPGLEAAAAALKKNALHLALSGGEDYELLFTASPRVKMPNKIDGIPVTLLGRMTHRAEELCLLDEKGGPVRGKFQGFRHF